MIQGLSDPTGEFSTLVDILRWRTRQQPDQRLYTYLADGETEGPSLTYAELDRQARAIGACLQSRVTKGERALLLYPPGLEFVTAFFGCLYAGVIAVPLPPPHPVRLDQTLSRFQPIMNDAQPSVALTTSAVLSRIEPLHTPDTGQMRWLASDTIDGSLAEAWHDPEVSDTTLAYLQYTSGSTAAPKGVMVSHGNLLYNERMIQRAFDHSDQSTVVGWLPLYHDMGLIGNVLQPLYIGASCVLLAPQHFLQRPVRWLQAISRYRARTSGAPNFAYDLCVRKTTPEQRAGLDLSSWTLAFNGAEPIRHDTLEQFVVTFEPCGFRRETFYPCYGLAEATLFVSGGVKAHQPVVHTVQETALEHHRVATVSATLQGSRTLVGCGHSWLNQQIVIVDPDTCTLCPPDRVGEIWVSGPAVAQGYWQRPEETAHAFRAYLADTGAGPFLRTGDLGFLWNGELYVTGRLKDMIIIRGRNYYPQDIELTVGESHAALRPGCGAAFSVQVENEEHLVVIQEVERDALRQLDVDAVTGAIRKAVFEEHDLHVHAVLLLKPASMPKTSSGKIQRHACRTGFLEERLSVVGMSTYASQGPTLDMPAQNTPPEATAIRPDSPDAIESLQSWMVQWLSRKLNLPARSIDTRKALADYGLDSVMTAQLVQDLEDWLDQPLDLDVVKVWSFPTLAALTDYLAHALGTTTLTPQTHTAQPLSETPTEAVVIQDVETSENALPSDACPMTGETHYASLDYRQWSPSQRLLQKIIRTLLRGLVRLQIEGQEHFPTSGPFLLAINHIHIWLDVPLFFSFVPRRTVYFAAERLRQEPFKNWFLTRTGNAIYVDRGEGDLRAMGQALTVLRAGGVIGIAPEGTISRDGNLLRGHTGIAHLAAQASVPVLPVVAYGQEQAEICWRRWRRVPVHIRVGSLIEPPSGAASVQQLQAYTDAVMATLAQMLPQQYRGAYTEAVQNVQSDPPGHCW